MSLNWKRWLRYAQAKLDSSVAEGEAELDRREAELKARSEERPWLDSAGRAPTLDEVRARIEHDAQASHAPSAGSAGSPAAPAPGAPAPSSGAPATTGPAPAGTDEGFDLAAHQAAADARLAAIRAELGLGADDDDPTPPAASG